MPPVVEYHYPADKLTFAAASAVVGGQLVKANGTNDQCVPATADATNVLGVAMYDGTPSAPTNPGKLVGVASKGVWPITASGAINCGDRVVAGANGTVKTVPAAGASYVQAEATIPSRVVGIAMADIADGAVGPIKLINLG